MPIYEWKRYSSILLANTIFPLHFQAQAQECILEKSMTDNRKSTITAKVAAQIVEYYKQASKYLDGGDTSSMIGSSKKKVRGFSQSYSSV